MAIDDVAVVNEDDLPFEELTPGIAVARAVTARALTELGGGWTHISDDSARLEWHLTYDEVLFVHRGRVVITAEGRDIEAHEGQAVIIRKGTTVTYQGTAGTVLFYTLFPANWATMSQGTT
jgi:ethanolamine utilization protein EutQ